MQARHRLGAALGAVALATSLLGGGLHHASAATLQSTSISITSDLNPAAPGTPLTFSGTIAPSSARGWVVLYDSSSGLPVEIGRVRVPRASHGMWTLTLNPFAGQGLGLGAHPLSAAYLGNATYQGSTSPIYTEVIRGAHW
jgi:hypothetical protein